MELVNEALQVFLLSNRVKIENIFIFVSCQNLAEKN